MGRPTGIPRPAARDTLPTPSPGCPPRLQEEHPCALHHFDQIAERAAGKQVAVFLDYDGEWPARILLLLLCLALQSL
jgi:hypothetical protein